MAEAETKAIRCVEAYSSAGNVWVPGQVVEDPELIPWLVRQAPSAWVVDAPEVSAPVQKVVRSSTRKEASGGAN